MAVLPFPSSTAFGKIQRVAIPDNDTGTYKLVNPEELKVHEPDVYAQHFGPSLDPHVTSAASPWAGQHGWNVPPVQQFNHEAAFNNQIHFNNQVSFNNQGGFHSQAGPSNYYPPAGPEQQWTHDQFGNFQHPRPSTGLHRQDSQGSISSQDSGYISWPDAQVYQQADLGAQPPFGPYVDQSNTQAPFFGDAQLNYLSTEAQLSQTQFAPFPGHTDAQYSLGEAGPSQIPLASFPGEQPLQNSPFDGHQSQFTQASFTGEAIFQNPLLGDQSQLTQDPFLGHFEVQNSSIEGDQSLLPFSGVTEPSDSEIQDFLAQSTDFELPEWDAFATESPAVLEGKAYPFAPITPPVTPKGPPGLGVKRQSPGTMTIDPKTYTHWRPIQHLLPAQGEGDAPTYLLVLNQPVENIPVFKSLWTKASFRIAADGAANRIWQIPGITNWKRLNVICGDLDSLQKRVQDFFMYNNAEIVQIDDQDTTDFEKCIDYLRSKLFSPLMVPNVIMCIGGFGGRVDHMMSQVHELYKATRKCAEDGNLVYYVTTESISWVLERGVHEIKVRDPAHPGVLGTKVGIAPFKGPAVVTTKGLQWDVEEWVTEVGVKMSTSNEVKDDTIYIETTHPIMFTIDLGPNAAPCESPPPAMSRNITDAHLTPFTDCVNFDSPQPVGGDIPMDG